MRWAGQQISDAVPADTNALPGMDRLQNLVRTVRTPEFEGITFHEVLAKSALNRVPAAARVPFNWTVNPYRGCSHACTYCFARRTHTYLDLDAGADFDSQIVVKVNVAEVLARELRRPSWTHEPVALGTNTDPYQRAEGRYQLMPGIITALAGSSTPFSILTKGTLARRDLPLLAEATEHVPVNMAVSIALADEKIHEALEPGAPTPKARLTLVRAITDAGLPCAVLVAPVLPMITDSDDQLDRILAQVAAMPERLARRSLRFTCDRAHGNGSCATWQPIARSWSIPTWSCTAAAHTSPALTPQIWPGGRRCCCAGMDLTVAAGTRRPAPGAVLPIRA